MVPAVGLAIMSAPTAGNPEDSRKGLKVTIFTSARSLREYKLMFDLGDIDQNMSILDCAGGASTFTMDAVSAGIMAIAVDTLYRKSVTEVERLSMEGALVAASNTRARPQDYQWGDVFDDPHEHADLRLTTARRFVDDFSGGRRGNYVAGSIFALPFADAGIDIVLSSHLMFTHASQISVQEHVLGIQEMLRVARREVRIYPVIGFKVDASPAVSAVMDRARSQNAQVRLVPSPYRFFQGAHEMLQILKDPSSV